MAVSRAAGLTVNACAKLNMTLRVLGVRDDGYHSLRTVFQSVALHDTLTFRPARGDFQIACDDPACPTDHTNLVWRAADFVWRAAGRRGRPCGVHVRIVKRIPVQAGLGGGSSDGAAAVRGLAALWRVTLAAGQMRAIAAGLGADVPFFLGGGTALGLERGDLLFPLADRPAAWVVLAIPAFGVSTKDAYAWWDLAQADGTRPVGAGEIARGRARGVDAGGLPDVELRNDLQAVVSARHPQIERLVRSLRRGGASYAAMSGSGSAVFGLFGSRARAEAACRSVRSHARHVLVTQTLDRARYLTAARLRPLSLV